LFNQSENRFFLFAWSGGIISNGASQLKICAVIGCDGCSGAADVIQDTSAAFFDFGLEAKIKEHDKKRFIIWGRDLPAYNGEEAIPLFYQAVSSYEPLKAYDLEIVFVNDGSQDRTESLINELRRKIIASFRYPSCGILGRKQR
jgi:hypothetical protein